MSTEAASEKSKLYSDLKINVIYSKDCSLQRYASNYVSTTVNSHNYSIITKLVLAQPDHLVLQLSLGIFLLPSQTNLAFATLFSIFCF